MNLEIRNPGSIRMHPFTAFLHAWFPRVSRLSLPDPLNHGSPIPAAAVSVLRRATLENRGFGTIPLNNTTAGLGLWNELCELG